MCTYLLKTTTTTTTMAMMIRTAKIDPTIAPAGEFSVGDDVEDWIAMESKTVSE